MDMLGKQTTVDTNKLQTLLKKIHMCFKVLLLNHYVDDYLCRLSTVSDDDDDDEFCCCLCYLSKHYNKSPELKCNNSKPPEEVYVVHTVPSLLTDK